MSTIASRAPRRPRAGRAAAATPTRPLHMTRVRDYTDLALRGLPASFITDTLEFSQTVRESHTSPSGALSREGRNLRYAAIVALGLGTVAVETQRAVLHGSTARDLVAAAVNRAADSREPGALALVAWAAAEVGGSPDPALLERLAGILDAGHPLSTVDTAWILSAAVAAIAVDPSAPHAAGIATIGRQRLLATQGSAGIFAHALPPTTFGRLRAHVGSFGDQAYPIQALARLAALGGDLEALAAAERCADRLCAVQGDAGQWWWHYDARDGSVVERYPVYSVHQHAMAPMALFDLAAAGGTDHSDAVYRGLDWLRTHPEVDDELVSEDNALIWRKAGRREPGKTVRLLAAATSRIHRGWRPPGIDRLFPVSRIDYECRPYELGWLLYAWRAVDGDTPSRR
ncbi:hypothetical protein G3T36_02810 [Diaminobutyricibacter tongyongensis]|uniref:N-acylglucosamine 2-epimerase n=1 Tax=Leifsonia tongyongensis TaxID=1268043 RepID=A0A6L9XTR3_9MICO|nr:hypothetical protein [Diaminobutyricibacter tongyongensis]NEN04792.1 hypothetical protein [Diaminobutyricibacter tongyongensis]